MVVPKGGQSHQSLEGPLHCHLSPQQKMLDMILEMSF